MKKIKTRLQLTKTTVRVLRDAELTTVRGGVFGSSANPKACAAADFYRPDGGAKL
jgi:hypothetical protein